MNTPILTPLQVRVVATLMEKARTVPDTYPLSLNSLVAGCNQKTSRDPVMNASDAQVLSAVEDMREIGLVREISGQRALRYEHNFQRFYGVPEQSAVLLGLLGLRGAQTAAELRANAERWYKFADVSSVEGFLDELQERSADKGGPLVLRLPRAPGEREARWVHLLSGAVQADAYAHGSAPADPSAAQLHERVASLEAQISLLQQTVSRLCQELGVPTSTP